MENELQSSVKAETERLQGRTTRPEEERTGSQDVREPATEVGGGLPKSLDVCVCVCVARRSGAGSRALATV